MVCKGTNDGSMTKYEFVFCSGEHLLVEQLWSGQFLTGNDFWELYCENEINVHNCVY